MVHAWFSKIAIFYTGSKFPVHKKNKREMSLEEFLLPYCELVSLKTSSGMMETRLTVSMSAMSTSFKHNNLQCRPAVSTEDRRKSLVTTNKAE